MKTFTWLDAAAMVVWLPPVIYLMLTYATLPATVPLHYGISGEPDSYGSKHEFLVLMIVLFCAGPLVYLLLKFLPRIDPKKQVKYSPEVFQKIGLGVMIFLSAINIIVIFATLNHGVRIDKLVLPLTGLFFAFMGNLMHSIKPNYFAGIRTPWTLESEDNWRATHRLAGKLWFAGGIALTVIILLTPAAAGTIIFMCGVGVLALFPVIYSYIFFKKHHADV